MDSPLLIILGCWLALNFVVVPLLGFLIARRREAAARTAPVSPKVGKVGAAEPELRTDGYAALLLSRLAVQACRILAVEKACLLVSDSDDPNWLIAVGTHGTSEDLVGQRVRIQGPLHSALATWTPHHARADRIVPAFGSGRAVATAAMTPARSVVLCAATADPAREFGPRDLTLLDELAGLCAAAVEDVTIKYRLDAWIRSSALGLEAAHSLEGSVTRCTVDGTVLAKRIGSRLRLEPGALLELELAASASGPATAAIPGPSAFATGADGRSEEPTLRADPTATTEQLQLIPGFEVVALIVQFIGERWDGLGPQRLTGERIPLASRILAACSALAVLITPRPCGAGANLETALRRIQAASGTVFDPTVVAALSHELLGEMPDLPVVAAVADWASSDAQYADLLKAPAR